MSAVKYQNFGNPSTVLKIENDDSVYTLKPSEVTLKMLASAITPADLALVSGVGELRPVFPAVGGLCGVGKVVAKGAAVEKLKEGDLVLPTSPMFGCWRATGKAEEATLTKVPESIPVVQAANLLGTYCVAYRLLNDFVALKEGDVLLQNGAESAVGQALIQLATKKGIKTVNIVSSASADQKVLTALGANVIVVEEESTTMAGRQALAKLGAPVLALDTLGGASLMSMCKVLGKNGLLVTYGGRNLKPVQIPTTSLIFNNISARGFSMARWLAFASPEEVHTMVSSVLEFVKEGNKTQNTALFEFNDFHKALQDAVKAGILGNVIVKM